MVFMFGSFRHEFGGSTPGFHSLFMVRFQTLDVLCHPAAPSSRSDFTWLGALDVLLVGLSVHFHDGRCGAGRL